MMEYSLQNLDMSVIKYAIFYKFTLSHLSVYLEMNLIKGNILQMSNITLF